MFSFGIFTTHLPYIAFVVLYAFFFLFGVKTSASEENLVKNSKFSIELQTSISYADSNAEGNFHYQTDIDFATLINAENCLFKRKISHQNLEIIPHWQYFLCKSLFSRPPPFLA